MVKKAGENSKQVNPFPLVGELLLDQGLQFYYEGGSITRVSQGEVAQWRVLPCANIAHITGGLWRVEFADRAPVEVADGEVLCIAAGVRHRSIMVSEGTSVSSWAHFNILLFGYIDLISFFELPVIFRGETAEKLGNCLRRISEMPAHNDPFTYLLTRKILEFEFAATLISNSTPRFGGEWRLQQIQRVLPVLEIVREDIAGEHTRESLAAAVHLSPSRFAAIFKDATGMAPIDYLVKQRMQRARSLLADEKFSVEQVAAAVGYQDAFYFSRLFKTHFGISPRQHRRELRELAG